MCTQLQRTTMVIALMALSIGGLHCGSGSSSSSDSGGGGTTTTTTATLQTTVTVPVEADISGRIHARSLVGRTVIAQPRFLEQVAEGMLVHAEDLSGNVLGNPGTTDATGVANITGLTQAQLEAGVVIVALDPDTNVPMHSYLEPTDEAIDAAIAGTPIEEVVDSTTDMAMAVIEAACGADGLATCGATTDMNAIREAVASVVDSDGDGASDDTPGSDDLAGMIAALYEAHQVALVNATEGVDPAALMADALEDNGSATGLIAVTGESIEDVPIADAASEFKQMIDTLIDSYCEKDETTGDSTWTTLKSETETEGETFVPLAFVGPFRELTPGEIANYSADHFKNFATNLPALGGVTAFGNSQDARRAFMEQMRLGAGFNDATLAGPALGMMMASFPKANGVIDFSADSAFDPSVAAQAAHNAYLELKDKGDMSGFDPRQIFENFGEVLSNSDHRRAFASGGGEAFSGFIDGFWENRNALDAFVPSQFEGMIKSPPGASCESDEDCLPCDSCVGAPGSKVCSSVSTTMGASCSDNDGCDEITTCTGSFIAGRSGQCMCSSAVPPGAFVHSGAEGPPLAFGTGFVFEDRGGGGAGQACGTGVSCPSGMVCSGPETGVCLPSDFKRPPFAACNADDDCASERCVANLCAIFSGDGFAAFYAEKFGTDGEGAPVAGGAMAGVGTKAIGQACSTPSECGSWFCSDEGVCDSPPDTFGDAGENNTLKRDGENCTAHYQCASFYCSGTCTAPTSGSGGGGGAPGGAPGDGGTFAAPTDLPAGFFCMNDSECRSLDCTDSQHMCR